MIVDSLRIEFLGWGNAQIAWTGDPEAVAHSLRQRCARPRAAASCRDGERARRRPARSLPGRDSRSRSGRRGRGGFHLARAQPRGVVVGPRRGRRVSCPLPSRGGNGPRDRRGSAQFGCVALRVPVRERPAPGRKEMGFPARGGGQRLGQNEHPGGVAAVHGRAAGRTDRTGHYGRRRSLRLRVGGMT